MNICVFCSQYDVADEYWKAAEELATLLAAHKHTLVFGGNDEGLMHVIADTAKRGGARVIAVIREQIKHKSYKDADETIIVKDSAEMNAGLIERADAVLVLVGGIGTLNELTDLLRMVKNGFFEKRIAVVNTNGFYEDFKKQLQRMHEEGFLKKEVVDIVHFAETPTEALAYLER
jgi:uncharacterized protein (TIGR00730 family)